jgi:uncharacterized protein YjbI with pentapeptide repeats
MTASIKASLSGLSVVDSSRKRKGWNKYDSRWTDAANVSFSTLKRFWMGKPISKEAFTTICEAVGMDWQQITDLKSGNLRQLLDQGVETWNEWKRQNPPLSHSFDNADLRELDLSGADFSKTSMIGANLSGANLEGANLSKADLTDANLNRANLQSANLTAVQALSTVFTGANFTGACIQDWNINFNTRLENVKCNYVYLKSSSSSSSFSERRPSSESFKPGEFSSLFQKALETVDLIFKDGIDWQAFFRSFQELRSKYSDQELSVQAIERKGTGAFIIRLDVPSEANKAAIESSARSLYEKNLELMEMRYHAELKAHDSEIETYRQQNIHLLEITRILSSKPVNLLIESGDNVLPPTININGDIHGSMNIQSISHHQNLSETAQEIQALLEKLTQQNTHTSDEILPKVHQVIEQNPILKEKLVKALKVGGIQALTAILDQSSARIPASVVAGWLEAGNS